LSRESEGDLSSLEPKDECSICEVTEDIWIKGYFGILPVTFCVNCFTCCENMILSMQEDEEGHSDPE
jgi:hypothetical protein